VLQSLLGENIRSVHAFVTDLKERAAKLQYQKQLLASRVNGEKNGEKMGTHCFVFTIHIVTTPKYCVKLLFCCWKVVELGRNGVHDEASMEPTSLTLSPQKWKRDFEVKQKQIFQVWDACHVSIIHRSQFYLLFRGDPTDAIYIDVELRRLLWLRNNYHLRTSRKAASRDSYFYSPSSR
jgi:centromeric protein E